MDPAPLERSSLAYKVSSGGDLEYVEGSLPRRSWAQLVRGAGDIALAEVVIRVFAGARGKLFHRLAGERAREVAAGSKITPLLAKAPRGKASYIACTLLL